MQLRSRIALFAGVSALSAAGLGAPAVSTASTGAPAIGCSWLVKSDPDVVNAAFPDTDATYWALAYAAVPGTKLVIHGVYPKARYFSFHAYDPTGVPVDSAYDAQLKPDRGSSNPFVRKVKPHTRRDYTVTVSFTAKPKHPVANTIYAKTTPLAGLPNPGGLLMYRVYVPVHKSSLAGSVPLPSVTTETASGATVLKQSDCETPQPSTNGALNKAYEQVPSVPSSAAKAKAAAPIWGRAKSSRYVGLFGNQQNAYLTAGIDQTAGQVAVIHAKAMTFPNTSAGQPAWKPSQVRYWSICENTTTTRVVDCAADYQIPRRHGDYTVVVSPTDERPSNATTKNGVAWIPWGAQPQGLLIFRTMVPSATFALAAQDVTGKTDAPKVMHAYYPRIHYCSVASFEKSGPNHCH